MNDRILDTHTIQQYLEGTLDPLKRHELEKQCLEDEFLSDALEGYTYVIEPAEKLSLLQQQLADRVLAQQTTKKAFGITTHRLSIAAAAGVMFVLAVILFWMNSHKTTANPDVKRVDVSLPVIPEKQPVTTARNTGSSGLMITKQNSSRSEPAEGWEEYIRYVRNNARFKAITSSRNKKDLLIAFKIGPSGIPVNLRLVNGAADGYSDEMMRVIKNGPLWKSADTEEVIIQINFNR